MKYLIIILLLAACQVKDPAPVRLKTRVVVRDTVPDRLLLIRQVETGEYEIKKPDNPWTGVKLRVNDTTCAAVFQRNDTALIWFQAADTLLRKAKYILIEGKKYTLTSTRKKPYSLCE